MKKIIHTWNIRRLVDESIGPAYYIKDCRICGQRCTLVWMPNLKYKSLMVYQQQKRVPSSRKLQIEGRIVALCYNLIHAFTFPYLPQNAMASKVVF